MSADNWLLLSAGTVLTTAAVIAFLYSLHYGLHRRKWLPLIIITGLWLMAMVIYAVSDSQNLEGSSRQRIIDGP